ncbi:MAG: protein kinase [Acidobacteria bacterium]|nr:protein kinase [Acidobacteriota bacterium]
MATVFLATDLRHDRRVALKVLRAGLAQALGPERFLREIRIAARLDHPHILALYDSGDAEGLLYYVMPFVDGESLRDRLTRERQLPIGDALRLAAQVADALAYAHKQGIVHRDIKPENILLSGGHAKVADFGIALAAGGADGNLTQTGTAIGTPTYMSPEQVVGSADLDGRSDLYSLGCVLFEMLAGSAPFGGANVQSVLARRFSEEAPRVASLRTSVPAMVDLVLARALARDRDERQATVGDFGAALMAEISGASVEASATAGPSGPQTRAALVGRERELSEAREFLDRLTAGKGGLLLIGGEPGVGKTRLSQAIMDEARARRVLCLVGHCYEMEGMPPFTPYAEMLDLVARQIPLRTFREVLGDAAPEIARIQPSLRDTFPDIPPPLELPPEQQRPYLFRKYREHLERAARVNPIMVLLDDLHWADDASLALLEHMAGYLGELPIFVIGTYRDVELEVNRPFARVLESLTRQRLATRIALRRLDEGRVAELLASLGGGSPPSQLVGVIFKETEGNPFFVEEVFHHLKEEGRLFDGAGGWRTDLKVEDLDVPEGVRLVIGRRLGRLTPVCRAVLTSAAVVGSRFGLAVLEALGEQTEDELLDALDAAVAAHLIVAQRGGREVVYGFAHELIRQTLLGTLSLPRRQRRHLKIATAMESVLGDRVLQRATDLAYHLYQAGAAADPDQTVKMLTLAAEQALAGAAFAEAIDHCDRAATIEEVTDLTLTGHLLRVRRAALKGLGRWPEARATLAHALEALNNAGDPVAAASVALDLAVLIVWDGDNQRAHDVCSAALRALPDSPSRERGRLLAWIALAKGFLGDSGYDDGLRSLSEARSMGNALHDESVIGFTSYCQTGFHFRFGRMDAAIAAAEAAVPLLRSPTDVQWRIDAAGLRLLALSLAGRFAEIDASIGEVTRVAEEVGHLGAIICCDSARSFPPLLRSGDLPGLEAWAEGTLTTWAAAGPWGLAQQHSRAMSQAERGDREAALTICTRARLAFPPDNQWTGAVDGCELWCMALLDRTDWPARYSECQHFLPAPGITPLAGRRWFAIYLLLAHVTRGDLAAAAALYPVLRQTLDDAWRVGPLQPVEGIVGLAAAAGGNWDVAEGHFRSALAFVDQIGDRLGKPSVQKWYAWMLLRRDAPGDRDRARALLDEAIGSFRALGMTLSLGQAEELRRSY